MSEFDTLAENFQNISDKTNVDQYLDTFDLEVIYSDRITFFSSLHTDAYDVEDDLYLQNSELFYTIFYSSYYVYSSLVIDNDGREVYKFTDHARTSSAFSPALESSEMTIASYSIRNSYEVDSEGNPLEGSLYLTYGVEDPAVSLAGGGLEGDWTGETWAVQYDTGELSGLRTKFGSVTGSTATSIMQNTLSASIFSIVNTANVSRFNFKKTKSKIINSNNLSTLEVAPMQNIQNSNLTASAPSTITSAPTSGGGY